MTSFDYRTLLTKTGALNANKIANAPILEDFPDVATSAYCSIHNIEPKRCLHCGKILPVISFRKGWAKNAIACSKECLQHLNHIVKEKREKTMLERYGAPNASNSLELKEKRKQTFIERFGSSSHLSNSLIREKIKNTNLERYGAITPLSNSLVQEKIKNTNLERYGTENPMCNSKISGKMIKTKRKKYNWKEKVTKPKYLFSYRRLLDHDSMLLLNNKDLLIIEYEKLGSFELARRLGCNFYLIQSYLRKHGYTFPKQKNKNTGIEKRITNLLDSKKISYRCNDREVLDGLEIDIYIPDFRVGIEVHGNFWHSYNPLSSVQGLEDKNKHKQKYELSKKAGITLLQFFEDEIENKWNIVQSIILNKLNLSKRIFARKTIVKEIDSKTAKQFCEENHLNGYAKSKMKLGLFFGENLVSVMTFAKSRFEKNQQELVRFCTKNNFTIVGGASKMLSFWKRLNPSHNLITYRCNMLGGTSFYEKLGFKKLKDTQPGYFWFDGNVRHHRQNFQKYKLKKLFPETFQENKTEDQIMFENGFRKIFNAGHEKFILNN